MIRIVSSPTGKESMCTTRSSTTIRVGSPSQAAVSNTDGPMMRPKGHDTKPAGTAVDSHGGTAVARHTSFG
ncbi:hypothetical protein ACIP4Y_13070 [Streptomyces sp. NPDC088810]|uniref:hypothetical protein n=1 Tax=Streptomyces sp. NPDC088810 TaxID=3365904 RepID=UPI00382D6B18